MTGIPPFSRLPQRGVLSGWACRSCVSWWQKRPALGAAYAAGLVVGYWRGLDDLRRNWQMDRTWQPMMADAARAKLYRGWKKAIERAMHWLEE